MLQRRIKLLSKRFRGLSYLLGSIKGLHHERYPDIQILSFLLAWIIISLEIYALKMSRIPREENLAA